VYSKKVESGPPAAQDAEEQTQSRQKMKGASLGTHPIESLRLKAPQCGPAGFRRRPYAQALTLAALPELPLVATVGALKVLAALVPAVLAAVPVLEALPVLSPYLLSRSAVAGSVVLEFEFCP
jgi:hypothetical protein